MKATVRHLRRSPQKVRLVADLIRGKRVGEAREILFQCQKGAAKDVEKVLLSAVANATNNVPEGGTAPDPDRLYIRRADVGDGPRLKRIRPQPMGRAFRILKRTCHMSLELVER